MKVRQLVDDKKMRRFEENECQDRISKGRATKWENKRALFVK
jgi:hypothetical protein